MNIQKSNKSLIWSIWCIQFFTRVPQKILGRANDFFSPLSSILKYKEGMQLRREWHTCGQCNSVSIDSIYTNREAAYTRQRYTCTRSYKRSRHMVDSEFYPVLHLSCFDLSSFILLVKFSFDFLYPKCKNRYICSIQYISLHSFFAVQYFVHIYYIRAQKSLSCINIILQLRPMMSASPKDHPRYQTSENMFRIFSHIQQRIHSSTKVVEKHLFERERHKKMSLSKQTNPSVSV